MNLNIEAGKIRGAVTLLIMLILAIGVNYIYKRNRDVDVFSATTDTYLGEASNDVDIVVDSLFEFDPNTADLRTLISLGLSKSVAVSIIKYREAGKIYSIKEDLYTCYGVNDSIYYTLEPYIVIADKYRLKPRVNETRFYAREPRTLLSPQPFLVDTVSGEYLRAIGALTKRQAEVFVKWRDLSGIRDMEEFRACYVVSDSIATALEPYIIFNCETAQEDENSLVDINLADSVELVSVYGIGGKSAQAIIDYRKKLGGFHSANQLSEIKMITESNFDKILQQISCDSCDISKIDVNFVPAKKLIGHPYISARMLRRLLKVRQLKGGWCTVAEMINDSILTLEEAERLRPYLLFRDQASRE